MIICFADNIKHKFGYKVKKIIHTLIINKNQITKNNPLRRLPNDRKARKMFRKNEKHHQTQLFDFRDTLGPNYATFQKTLGYKFYQYVFCNIDEEQFRPLYSEHKSAPNSPINMMVAALLWQHHNNWTFEQLENHILYDLSTRKAIGSDTRLGSMPFTIRTLYGFKEKMASYEAQKGENLFAKLFDRLTQKQVKSLQVNTGIQRCDTVQLQSNIRQYSRIEFLVEILHRLHRILSHTDKATFEELFKPYIGESSTNYTYRLRSCSLSESFSAIGVVYTQLHTALCDSYGENAQFKLFARVYKEHFRLEAQLDPHTQTTTLHTHLIAAQDLPSNILGTVNIWCIVLCCFLLMVSFDDNKIMQPVWQPS